MLRKKMVPYCFLFASEIQACASSCLLYGRETCCFVLDLQIKIRRLLVSAPLAINTYGDESANAWQLCI